MTYRCLQISLNFKSLAAKTAAAITICMLTALPVSGVQKPWIKIGTSVSLSGKHSLPSSMLQNAYRLWKRQTNENGGLLGRPIKLVFYDDKSNPETCRKIYQKLIHENKVDLVLAPYGSALTYAASEVTEKNGYVLAGCAASAPQIWERGYTRVFGFYATADRYFIGYLDILARRELKTIAVIYEDSTFPRAAAQGARTWAERFGLQVVFYQGFRNQPRQLEKLTGKALAIQPHGMIFCLYPPDAYAILKFIAKGKKRFNSTALTIAPAFDDFYAKAGSIAEGIFGPTQWEPDARIPYPGSRQFIADFRKFTGATPTYHAASAYTACQMLARAVEKTGSLDQEKIADYIRSLDMLTIIGRFKVDHCGRQVGHNPLLIQWQKGRKKIVYPTKLQTARPVFNKPQKSNLP